MKIKVEFSQNWLAFLQTKGFTHMYKLGVRGEEAEYLMEPLKQDDQRLQYDDTGIHIEEINSDEIIEISQGFPFIVFYILIDTVVFEEYAKL